MILRYSEHFGFKFPDGNFYLNWDGNIAVFDKKEECEKAFSGIPGEIVEVVNMICEGSINKWIKKEIEISQKENEHWEKTANAIDITHVDML